MHVATVTVAGFVTTVEDVENVAEEFWKLHSHPCGCWELETIYTPKAE